MKTLHWIDDADHWRCPICGLEVGSPAYYPDYRCPVCCFQDEKDKKDNNNDKKGYL